MSDVMVRLRLASSVFEGGDSRPYCAARGELAGLIEARPVWQ
jgi:hypothetical protein